MHTGCSDGAREHKIEDRLGRVRNGRSDSAKREHTGSQQHELDNKADPSGRAPEAHRRTRAKSPVSLGLGLSSPEGGQLWHDMLRNGGRVIVNGIFYRAMCLKLFIEIELEMWPSRKCAIFASWQNLLKSAIIAHFMAKYRAFTSITNTAHESTRTGLSVN